MILELIEDYQKVIINSNAEGGNVKALIDFIKHILDTKTEMINSEIQERRKKEETDRYVKFLMEKISKLEETNERILESINGLCEADFEFDMESPSMENFDSENAKKIQIYRENSVLLENSRAELKNVSLGFQPSLENTPSQTKVEECVKKVNELYNDVDSVINKITENISYNFSLIEQLDIKYTMIGKSIEEVEKKLETKKDDTQDVPFLKRGYVDVPRIAQPPGTLGSQGYQGYQGSVQREKRDKSKYNKNKERNELRKASSVKE